MPLRSLHSGRRRLLPAVLVAAVAAGLAALALVRGSGNDQAPPPARANDLSGRATACLAADSATAAGNDTVSSVWTAMQKAGTQHGTNVQQMIAPAIDAGQSGPVLAGLVTQRCDLIVTVGAPFGQAGPALASAVPSLRI
ncbi:hypothetical protein, partial [Kitasatospora sp. A2-31]